jgi:hypothetical protein
MFFLQPHTRIFPVRALDLQQYAVKNKTGEKL